MEVSDSETSARRCWRAAVAEQDLRTRVALARACGRYAMRLEPGRRLEIEPPGLPRALELGS